MMRAYVVKAVFKRNFVSHFTSAMGYVFTVVFILGCAWGNFFYDDRFFAANIANLAPLNFLFPLLLLFFIPSITMGAWADERRHGTDELLLTLPARDAELVIGKYLASVGIYSVALLFSLSLVAIIGFLGAPDLGVMLGSYLGYWLLGCSLLAIGMVASQLTQSMPIAFILAAVFCFVSMYLIPGAVSLSSPKWGSAVSVLEQFQDLSRGVLSVQALLFFASLIVVMLYLNLVLLARRHIAGGPGSGMAWVHFTARALALLVAGVALSVLADRFGTRLDLTAERLHSLSPQTREQIFAVDASRPVYVQAYVSPRMPRAYVDVRENLLSMLREFGSIGGGRIQYQVVDTLPYSPEARDAEEKFGIKPLRVGETTGGRSTTTDVFLGVAMTCGPEETVIPFMYKGYSVEYELMRSIGVVTGAQRKRIGIATTDAKVMGGLNFETFSRSPSWQVVEELKKQYEVVEVSLDQPIVERLDVLVAIMPSSCIQPQLNHLANWIRRGNPTLICDDPFAAWSYGELSALRPKSSPGRGGMFQQPSGEQKGDIRRLLEEFGIIWYPGDVVWDVWNPLPRDRFQGLQMEFVFAGPASGAQEAFNSRDPISSDLQLMVMIAGGHVTPAPGPMTFTPLIRNTTKGGVVKYQDLSNPAGAKHDPSHMDYVLAARVVGRPAAADQEGDRDSKPVHLVFVPDADLISDAFFRFRQGDMDESLNFDNVTFILNAVDVLAGDTRYVPIRKRRPKHRTLTRLEEQIKNHRQKQVDDTRLAENTADERLKEANQRLQDKIAELEKRTDIDDTAKQIMLQSAREVEQRRLDVEKKKIDDEKGLAIERSNAGMEAAIRRLQERVRWIALPVAPLPAIIVGIVVLLVRLRRRMEAV